MLTAHVNVNAGTGAGYVNAPAGTLITFSIVSRPRQLRGRRHHLHHGRHDGLVHGDDHARRRRARPSSGRRPTSPSAASSSTARPADGKAGDSADAQKNWIPDVGITSVQKLKPNDAATVTPGDGTGPTPTGTVTFRLYPPSDTTCSGTASFTQTVTLTNGSASTSNTSVFMQTSGKWRWRASYSGDANYQPTESPCGFESTTIVNG